jgi:uncharacterized membrane protein YobD (UPF0266 family)
MSELNLGKLQAVYGIATRLIQRAVIVSVLSFIFFLAMMVAFYLRQNIGYFLLSTAFLLVYLLTMFGWLWMRKNIVKIYENGFTYKKNVIGWSEIKTVALDEKRRCEIEKTDGEKIVLPETIQDVEQIAGRIKSEISARKETGNETAAQ